MSIITRGRPAPALAPVGNRVNENIHIRGCLLLHTSASKGYGKVPRTERTVMSILKEVYGTSKL